MKPFSFRNARKSDVLRQIVLQSIESGELKPGQQLPTEFELIERYQVSRTTVREAVASLVHEGLLRRFQGKGTFVTERRIKTPAFAIVMPYLFATDLRDFGAGADVIPLMVQAIEAECRADRAKMVLLLDNKELCRERENLLSLMNSGFDGAIVNYIGGEENLDCLDAILRDGPPLVLIDRYVDGLPADYVVSDNAAGAAGAVDALAEAGFPDVIYVTAPLDNSARRDREVGYRCAMTARGKAPRVMTLPEAISRLPDSAVAPLGFLTCEADPVATIWTAFQASGLAVENIALACFDEPYIRFPPDLTTVRVVQRLQEMGALCVQIARERAEQHVPFAPRERRFPKQIKLAPVLYVSDSRSGGSVREIVPAPNGVRDHPGVW